MSLVAKSGNPSLATGQPCPAHQTTGIAAENMKPGDVIYVGNDNLLHRSIATTVGALAGACHGMVGGNAYVAQNDSVTAHHGVVFNYGSGLTPGTALYVSGVYPGGLDTAPFYVGQAPCAIVVPVSRVGVSTSPLIRVIQTIQG